MFRMLLVLFIALLLSRGGLAQSPTPAETTVPLPATPAVMATETVPATPAAVESVVPATPAAVETAVPTSPGPEATVSPVPLPMQPGQLPPGVEIRELPTPDSHTTTWWQAVILTLYFIVCVSLVLLVMFTTTKNEGMTGIIGGAAQSTLFKGGKKSVEEQLGMWTSRLAWTFLVSSLIIYLVVR